ncbi:lipopolysaccharide-induced tumor necrosis factor-alpha factor homolog [Ostrinia nubilalis]|uniref:lipopolysaccharide-induced tumor necrosis factor-alpha factor homolog n=1 Tax=Ostrinia nubilalis TaxID=29057 RepID=UPI00308255F4
MASGATTSAPVPSANAGPLLLGPENTILDCPFCHHQIKTAVQYTNNSGTHIAAALWGRICFLCCIPYCGESAKNADHYCPNCAKYLGTYRR